MPLDQTPRLLSLATPLPYNQLAIQRFRATEAISQLFQIELEILGEVLDENAKPKIEDPQGLIGQPMAIRVTQNEDDNERIRYFHGICVRLSQGNRTERYTKYKATLVPRAWLLTKRVQSRIFQQKSVPDILNIVLEGLNVKYEIQGSFEPRNYCVQYRESDWDFASRLMEEEGIFYFFEHTENDHRMVVANTSQSHPKSTGKDKIPFAADRSGVDDTVQGSILKFAYEDLVTAGKYTLWDHKFELVGKKFEAQEVSRFSIGGNQNLEVYDFPGEFAQRFDGISAGGGEQSSVLQKIFQDNKRTAKIRQEELDVEYRQAHALSDSCGIIPGYKIEMENHPHGDYNGSYVPISVVTEGAQTPTYSSDENINNPYVVTFSALSLGKNDSAPFRPPRITPKPVIHGQQTAVVVGPAGEEIFTDKYGRVKVQFHWDRHGENDQGSSCWLRVAQNWGGKKWGTMFIPRIGMEAIVGFMEGDPDQPIMIGSVYNAENMPPYTLPDEKTKSTIKTNSSKGGGGFNEIRFEDKKGSEQIFVHAQKDYDLRVLNDQKAIVLHDKHSIVAGKQQEWVKGDKSLKVTGDQVENINGNVHLKVGSNYEQKAGLKFAVDAGNEVHLKAGSNVTIEAGAMLTLKAGGNFVSINSGGVFVKGTIIGLNSGGAAGSGSGASPGTAPDPTEADKAEAGQVTHPPAPPPTLATPQFKALAALVQGGAPGPQVMGAIAAAQANAEAAAQNAAQEAKSTAAAIVEQVQNQASAAAGVAMAAAQSFFDKVKSAAQNAKNKAESALDKAKALAEDLKNKGDELIDKALAAAEEAKQKAEAMKEKVESAVEEAKQAAEEKIDEAKEAFNEAKAAAEEKVKEAEQALDDAKQQAEQAAAEMKQEAEQAVDEAKAAVNEAKAEAEQAVAEAKQEAEQAVAEAKQEVAAAKAEAQQAAQEAKQEVEEAATEVKEQATQAADEVKQQAAQASQAATNAVQSAQNAIPFM